MSDDGQTLFIIHANGQSYIELGKEGTIDMYSTNSVNIRTQGDLNLHADNNINMHAKKDLNFYGENINLNSDKKTNFRIGTDYNIQSLGQYTLKVGSGMSLASSGEASFASSAVTFVNGSKINLNTGSASLVPQEVKPLSTVAHTDTLHDATKGWAAAPGTLLSITSRAPAHAPWSNANQGVDVKVDNSASANFPSAPAAAVAATNASVPGTPTTPVAPSVASTVPVAGAVSKAIDKNTTTAMVGQVATMAQTGPAAAAVKAGAGVVQTSSGAVVAVGKMAQSPQQMEAAGVLKPGSAALINSLVSSGKTIEQAMTPNLFTGKPGAENVAKYINNPTAQVQTQVANFQQAQTQLTQAGVITGNEASGQIAGLVTATASVGLANTVDYVKSASGAINGAGSATTGGVVNSMIGNVTGAISSGNYAANLSSVVTGGLGSIATSLSGLTKTIGGGVGSLLDSAKGLAGSAFSAITKGFPTLKAGEPQNLKQIADKAIADVQASGTDASNVADIAKAAASNSGIDAAAIASGAASSAINGLDSVNNAVTTGLGSTTNIVSATENAVSAVSATLPASASSGLSGLPGAQNAVATVVKGVPTVLPGSANITGAISQVTSSISTGVIAGSASALINKLKAPGASLLGLASVGLSPGLAAKLNSSISSLSSGGAVPITLPVVGEGTTNRTDLVKNFTDVLNDPKIPAPNYNGNPATTGETAGSAALSKQEEKIAQVKELQAEYNAQNEKRIQALAAYEQAKQDLPAGDPGIEAAEATAKAELIASLKLQSRLTKLLS